MNVLDNYNPSEDLMRLANTDQEAAQLKRAVEAQAYILKKTKYLEFLNASGNNEVRKAISETSQPYDDKTTTYLDAVEASETLQNERKTCQLRIDVWRSLNANRRQGQ